jgi:protoheme IX farnesyltransferase
MKSYSQLTKTGIILFALASSLAGFAMSFPFGQPLELASLGLLMGGLYLVCAGSFALNQAQEWRTDALMDRTSGRPIPRGFITPGQAVGLAVIFLLVGHAALYLLNPLTAGLSLLTVILYNGVYTLIWKRHWTLGAVPGAVPGAMPVMIGYSVNSNAIFSSDCIYLFLIMFLWQMPHFWCLAIRYRQDYDKGGFPVLPAQLGISKTLYHIGLYVFAYAGIAMASPWFLKANWVYLLLVWPIACKMLWEFRRYFKGGGEQRWLSFFLWTNLSMLVFLGAPVIDKWLYFLWA